MKTIKTATILFCIFPYVVAFTPGSSDTSLTTLDREDHVLDGLVY